MDGVVPQTQKDIVHVCFATAIKKRGLDIVNIFSMIQKLSCCGMKDPIPRQTDAVIVKNQDNLLVEDRWIHPWKVVLAQSGNEMDVRKSLVHG